MKEYKLTKRDRDLLDDLALSAKWYGWSEDQGTERDMNRDKASCEAAYKAMERRLARRNK